MIRFGIGVATCREGKTFRPGYMRPTDFLRVARHAEQLGYYSLWGDDHLTTHRGIEASSGPPPNYYEPLITYASLANVTERLRFLLGVIVLPMREPVLLAKQVATLDVLTGGRVMLGLGIGGNREEFEMVRPDLSNANRGALIDEGVQALRRLFDEPVASFEGKYLRFRDIELAPKPHQNPFPIYLNARESAGLRRIARVADGWIVTAMPLKKLAQAQQELDTAAREYGRDPASISRNFQLWVAIGRDPAEAIAKLKRSSHFRWMVYQHPERSEDGALAKFKETNVVGSPEEIVEQLRPYLSTGDVHLGLIFLNDSVAELLGDLELFAERVMPSFAPTGAAAGRSV